METERFNKIVAQQILDVTQLQGRVVRNCVAKNGKVVLAFEDGAFVIFTADGYETSLDVEAASRITYLDENAEAILKAGVVTQQEYDDEAAAEERATQERRKASERDDFERIKARYESMKSRFETSS